MAEEVEEAMGEVTAQLRLDGDAERAGAAARRRERDDEIAEGAHGTGARSRREAQDVGRGVDATVEAIEAADGDVSAEPEGQLQRSRAPLAASFAERTNEPAEVGAGAGGERALTGGGAAADEDRGRLECHRPVS